MQRLVLLAILFDVAPSCGPRKRPEPPPPAAVGSEAPPAKGTSAPSAAPYNPCGGKKCGEPCRICPPSDANCVETMELKSCDASGACRSSSPTCP